MMVAGVMVGVAGVSGCYGGSCDEYYGGIE